MLRRIERQERLDYKEKMESVVRGSTAAEIVSLFAFPTDHRTALRCDDAAWLRACAPEL